MVLNSLLFAYILNTFPALMCGEGKWSKSSSPSLCLALQLCLVLMGNLNPIYENKYYFICLCLSIPAFNEVNYNTAQVTKVSSTKSKVRNQYSSRSRLLTKLTVQVSFLSISPGFTLHSVDDEYYAREAAVARPLMSGHSNEEEPQPIRGQCSGHVICVDQSEARRSETGPGHFKADPEQPELSPPTPG